MDHITEAFYNVMYQTSWPLRRTAAGELRSVAAAENTTLELLRQHPNWREEELAVVFDLSEQRQLDQPAWTKLNLKCWRLWKKQG